MEFESTEYKVVFFIGSVLVWSAICVLVESTISFKSLTPKQDHDVKNRIVSILHGTLTLILAGYSLFVDKTGYTDPNTDVQHFAILTSMGYFLYDLIACVYYDISDRALWIHHSLAMFGYFTCVYYNNSTLSMVGLFYAELSNPPMHLRAIFRSFGMRYTISYELCDIAYIVIYIIARGVFITYAIYQTLLNGEIPFLLRFTCFSLWAQSVYFMNEMVGILRRKNKQYKERVKKGIPYFWLTENPEIKKLSYANKQVKENVF